MSFRDLKLYGSDTILSRLSKRYCAGFNNTKFIYGLSTQMLV